MESTPDGSTNPQDAQLQESSAESAELAACPEQLEPASEFVVCLLDDDGQPVNDFVGVVESVTQSLPVSPEGTAWCSIGFTLDSMLIVKNAAGKSLRIGFAPGSATLPSLAALVDRPVTITVHSYFNGIYMGGSDMTMSDDRGLVLALNASVAGWGPASAMSPPGSALVIRPADAICEDWCARTVRALYFDGDSTQRVAPGEVGTVSLGGTAYSVQNLWYAERTEKPSCADGFTSIAWAVWRAEL